MEQEVPQIELINGSKIVLTGNLTDNNMLHPINVSKPQPKQEFPHIFIEREFIEREDE